MLCSTPQTVTRTTDIPATRTRRSVDPFVTGLAALQEDLCLRSRPSSGALDNIAGPS